MPKLTEKQIDYFDEFGFLPLKNVFDPEKILDPIISEYHSVLDNLCSDLVKENRISSSYEKLNFGERITKVMQETGEVHAQYFDFSLPFQGVKKDTPMWFGEAIFKALVCEEILDIVESIIGSEIYSNPVQHVRIKPPERLLPKNEMGQPIIGATAYHQDAGVVNEKAQETEMLTVWFPIFDAPVEAGPLKVVPGSHKGELLRHCANYKNLGLTQIPEHLFDEGGAVPVPLDRGDLVILHKKTVHASLSNISDNIRWSFDLRYNPIGQDTGREVFPGFVARSRDDVSSEFRDANKWKDLWEDTRIKMSEINQDGMSEFNFNQSVDCA
tara:strand:- start:455 stop:1435 length:981 start_codon:yes stop_codon:yes gene_type:complete